MVWHVIIYMYRLSGSFQSHLCHVRHVSDRYGLVPLPAMGYRTPSSNATTEFASELNLINSFLCVAYLYISSIMFEPHLNGFDSDRSGENGSSLLEELDKMAPIQRFDAFPKVCLEA